MFVRTLNGVEFECLARDLLENGHAVRFRAHGISMRPFIRHGDLVEITPVEQDQIRMGDVVLCSHHSGRMLLHRVIHISRKASRRLLLIQGDAVGVPDGFIDTNQVLGRACAVQHGEKRYQLDNLLFRVFFWLWALTSPLLKTIQRRVARC